MAPWMAPHVALLAAYEFGRPSVGMCCFERETNRKSAIFNIFGYLMHRAQFFVCHGPCYDLLAEAWGFL